MRAGSIVALIPFFNRQHTILAALQSVESQTLRPEQLFLVDDGSTDQGAALVATWMKQVGGRLNCRLVKRSNGGVATARNHGLSLAAASEFVAFLDSDDCWPADYLEHTQAALSARPDAVAASCDYEFVFADGRPSKRQNCLPLATAASLWMLENGAGIVSSTLFRRAAIERRGVFNPNFATSEDAALFLPLTLDGPWLHVAGPPVTLNLGLAQQRGDEGNLSQKHCDNELTRALVYHKFFFHGGGQQWLAHAQCRRLLAKRWYRAGRQLFRIRAYGEALACFQKSAAFDPWRANCIWRLCRAWLGTFGGRHTKKIQRSEMKSAHFSTSSWEALEPS